MYKIDAIDRRILYELDKNCRSSDNQLARMVKRSREAVRNRIKKLQVDGIIEGFITSINPSKFGYSFYKLYFQLANKPAERKRFNSYFRNLPGIYWYGGNDGVWDFHATIYAKNDEEFNALKNKLYTEFKELIIKREFGILLNVRQYPKRYLFPESKERIQPAIYSGEREHRELEQLDRDLLTILSHQARTPLVELALKTNSTVDIVRNRIRKMQQQGIILQYRVAVDHRKLGYEAFKAFIYFENLSEQTEKKLLEYAHQHPEILLLIRQLSAWDIELEVVAKSYEEFITLMNDIRLQFAGSIRNYEFCVLQEDVWHFGEKQQKD